MPPRSPRSPPSCTKCVLKYHADILDNTRQTAQLIREDKPIYFIIWKQGISGILILL